jgi:hypothetical protein
MSESKEQPKNVDGFVSNDLLSASQPNGKRIAEYLCNDNIWRAKWIAEKCGDIEKMESRTSG